MGTIKSGWLQKLSGFFKNTWKKRYFVLYQSGDFCYYQDPHDKEVDGKINMKTECRKINVGHGVGEGVKAPKDIDALFSVVSTERTFYLVADSAVESREWVAALEQARIPVSYGAGNISAGPYPQQARPAYGPPPAGPPPAYTPQAAPGQYPMPTPGVNVAAAYPPPAQAYPPQPHYPQQPAPYPQPGYPPQPYPQQPAPPRGYAPPPPGYQPPPQGAYYPQQQYRPQGPTVYAQAPGPQTVYVQNPNQGHSSSSSGRNKMMMGAGAGALGGAAMGYMLGRASGGYGGHGFGGWHSDHSWSSGSFDCDFD